ncbi:unnamed protein product [Meganyctiphanes norvegica]|uniref:Uncharacterized protein n=1 Tax=Meganyctiphanes norvegica TaxID=48144 RepID=A0AAV2Q8M6_MEGNR
MRAWCGNLLQAWWWWLPGLLVPLLTWWPHIAQAGSGQSKDFPGGSKVFHTQEKEPGFIDYVKHKTWSRILFSSTRPNQNVHMEWWDIKGKLRDVDFTIEQPERWYIATLYQTMPCYTRFHKGIFKETIPGDI